MDITSPFVVVPVIAAVFFACILWATNTGPTAHHPTDSGGHAAHR